MKTYTIASKNNFKITVNEFSPSVSNEKTIVFAPAVGVPQKFYFNIAKALQDRGCHVFTFDYRGIGASKPKELSSIKNDGFFSWASDFNSVSKYVKEKLPNNTQYLIGHSFGGNSLGFSDAYQYYDKYLTVGSQFGYYKNFRFITRKLILLNFKFFVPITTKLLGYYPSSWFGLGNPLPSKAATDWASYLLEPESMLYLTKVHQTSYYDKITNPMLLVSIEDDTFAPEKTVDLLGSKIYSKAQVKRKHLIPKEYNLKTIGHFDFFRKKNEKVLWPLVYDWFDLN